MAYRGDPEADRDVIGGRVDAAFNWTILAAPLVNSGQLKALAVLSPHRSVVMPGIPTSAEAGMPDLLVNAWTALFFPKGTPQPIIEQVNAALQKAFADDVVVKRMNTIGLDVPITLEVIRMAAEGCPVAAINVQEVDEENEGMRT